MSSPIIYTKEQEHNDRIQGLVFFIYMGLITSLSFGLLFGGKDKLEEGVLIFFLTYVFIALIFGIINLIIHFMQRILRKKKSTAWIKSYDFSDRDKIPKWVLKLKFSHWITNPWKLLVISIAVFSTLILVSGIFGTFFTAFPEMQVKEATDIFFSGEPVTLAENGMILFTFGLGFGLSLLLSKWGKDKATFVSLMIINVIINTLLFMWWHSYRYPEFTDLWAVGIFAFFGLMITWATGSIIPFAVFHISDNVFNKIATSFGNFDFILVAVLIVVISWILVILISKFSKPAKLGRSAKINFKLIFGLILFFIIGGFLIRFGIQKTAIFDDYATYDDFIVPEEFVNHSTSGTRYDRPANHKYETSKYIYEIELSIGSINIGNGLLIMRSGCFASPSPWRSLYCETPIPTLTLKENFKSRDVKIIGKSYYLSAKVSDDVRSQSIAFLSLNNNRITLSSRTDYGVVSALGDSFAIELKSSKLDYNIVYVFINGEHKETIDLAGEELKIAISGLDVRLSEIKFKVPFNCKIPENHFLGFETFSSKQVSLYSMTYAVKSYCLDHPVIITSATEKGSTATAEPYQKFVQGETLYIPEDQTWTIFYVFENDGTIPVVCKLGDAYDVKRGMCTNVTGIVHICSEGQFDPSLGLCVVQAKSKIICDAGRYDIAQDVCIYNPPIQNICEKGTFIPETGKCEYKPDTEAQCGDYTYNPLRDICEAFPLKTIICEPNFAYNAVTDKCERYVISDILCDGVYDSATGKCTKEVEADIKYICEEGILTVNENGVYSCVIEPEFVIADCEKGIYNPETGFCEFIPQTEAICDLGNYNEETEKCEFIPSDIDVYCPQGDYDIERNACVIKPNLQYLCLKGTISEDGTYCLIYPTERIICEEGFVYDESTEQCVKTAQNEVICKEGFIYNSETDTCIKNVQQVINCPENSVYDEDLKKCVSKETFVGFLAGISKTTKVIFTIVLILFLTTIILLLVKKK